MSFSYIFPPSPRVHITEVVGSENGVSGDELALAVLENIKGRFSVRGLSWSSIYVLKSGGHRQRVGLLSNVILV